MGVAELFEKTGARAKPGKKKSARVVISKPPRRIEPDVKPALPKGHRYGPEDCPPPLSAVKPQVRDRDDISPAPERTPLAYCMVCRADRPMKWKPRNERGKDVSEWFTCAICGCGRLGIKILTKEGT